MQEESRHTNRVVHQARLLCEQARSDGLAGDGQPSPALAGALEAGAVALADKALAAAVVEFAGMEAPGESPWYPWLTQHQQSNAELSRLYLALTEGELAPLLTRVQATGEAFARPVPVHPGMIVSDAGSPRLDTLLDLFSTLLTELREGAIEW